jgi:cytochrome c peroxidase
MSTPFRRLLLLGAALLACAPLRAREVRVSIAHTFGGEPLQLDSLRYPAAAGETVAVTRLSYLLSGFALQARDGSWIALPDDAAWIDLERRRTGFTLRGVPPGAYTALRLAVGLDAVVNHAAPEKLAPDHPLNPNLNGLHWNWQGGYVFLALEGRYRSAAGPASPEGFVYHLARDPNRTVVTMPASLTVGESGEIALELDVAALLGGSFQRDGNSTHSRDKDAVAARLTAALPHAFRAAAIPAPPAAPAPPPLAELHLPATYTPYRFTFNRSFPRPNLPRDNPLIEERVQLGKLLFSDPQLSRDGTVSCATCHRAENAFAEPARVSRGVGGRTGERNAMPLFNLAWKSAFFWDGRAATLREQALVPIQEHREMDLPLAELAPRLAASASYRRAFAAAFDSAEVTPERVGLALEQFLLTLVAGTSKFDRALRGAGAFSPDEQRGFELFMTEFDPRTGQRGADCFHCHGGPLFTDHQFHHNGLPIADGDLGREAVTHAAADRGKFATPSLRNLARTAPYMHDGRFATLEEVVAHYSGPLEHTPTLDPNLAKHPAGGLQLPAADQAALVAFLRTLSEE